MRSWSDSFLNSVNDSSQIVGLIALVFTLASAYLIYATGKEISRRATEREQISNKRADDLQQKADDAIARAKKLEDQNAPRILIPEQTSGIISELIGDGSPKSVVIYFQLDSQAEDSQTYGNSIALALEQAGYQVLHEAASISAGLGRDITVLPGSSPDAEKILLALIHNGVRATNVSSAAVMGTFPLGTPPPSAITIGVGKRSIETQ